jgi:hypothetical protein
MPFGADLCMVSNSSATCTTYDRHETRFTWHNNLFTLLKNCQNKLAMGIILSKIKVALAAGWKPTHPDH